MRRAVQPILSPLLVVSRVPSAYQLEQNRRKAPGKIDYSDRIEAMTKARRNPKTRLGRFWGGSDEVARFWLRVSTFESCWQWTGSSSNGYGIFWTNSKKRIPSHRYSYEIANGPIPDGMLVCHRCDNPPCVRPDHLFLGTDRTNKDDNVAKKRHAFGSKIPQAKLSWDKAQEIRQIRKTQGLQFTQLAQMYGVTEGAIRELVKGRTWKFPG